jgi:uncharacterized repeat protein (TIGR03803 family)
MKTFARFALSLGAAALIAACGASQSTIGAPGAGLPAPGVASAGTGVHRVSGSSYEVLYRFHDDKEYGAHPFGNLTDVNGTLYGVTSACGGCGSGVIYSMSTAGIETVLHYFEGGSTGSYPSGELLNVNGTLYATTLFGGSSSYGTVYSITTTGVYKTLYNFTGGSDGATPVGRLIDVNGTLYGTTQQGGGTGCGTSDYRHGCGTVYSVSTNGDENVLYRFSEGDDGWRPNAGLVDVKGTLYGTTYFGGKGCGCGTVYSMTTAGKEKVVHSFQLGSDGGNPSGGLIAVKGTLYGTTEHGGSGCSVSYACGTVFSLTTTGKEKVLYSFKGPPNDGIRPSERLVSVGGTLYGTTEEGGSGSGCFDYYSSGCGTVYSVSGTGSETVLHDFSNDPDGAGPRAGLTDVKGTLYGTTFFGGEDCRKFHSCGTVFTLVP